MSDAARSDRAAVIDIGSNSVRLVIFALSDQAMLPTFNEKVMAGLGRGLGETGRLSPEGRSLAIAALSRFRAILDGLGITQVRAVATAAVRVAEDGQEFAREAAVAAGVQLTILSGMDEGRLSARGVCAGFNRPEGIVADLGGSSLELFGVGSKEMVGGETHMLGPLALAGLDDASEDDIRAHIRTALKSSLHVQQGAREIYAVGGAWRAFSKVAIKLANYPLSLLHGYELSANQVSHGAGYVMANRGSGRLTSIAGRRGAQLHLTSIVLDELVRAAGARRVVISSFGLREGVIAEIMGLGDGDALADSVKAFAGLSRYQAAFGEALHEFVRPLFAGEEAVVRRWRDETRLHRAACLLADSAGRYHPDHRDEMGFQQALYAPLSGLDHRARLFIASAVGWRYARGFNVPKALLDLMPPAHAERARQLGHAMRLGAVFSGRSGAILPRASLQRDGNHLVFCLASQHRAMLSETVERRFNQTADCFCLKPIVSIG